MNWHLHALALDGWFYRAADGQIVFEPASAPTQADVEALVLDVFTRVMRLLERGGWLDRGGIDPLSEESPLAACDEGAVTQRVGLGPARGSP